MQPTCGVLELPELPGGQALELHLVTRPDGRMVARWFDAQGRVLRVAAIGTA